MNVIPLVNKPYVNEVTLNEKPISKILLVLSIENMYIIEVQIFPKRYCGSL